MVEQLLHVIDRQQVLSVHRDDNSVPDLRNQNLGFILDLHVGGGQDLGVDTLGKTREDIPPRSPD